MTPVISFVDPDLKAPTALHTDLLAMWENLAAYAENVKAGERALANMAGASDVLFMPDDRDVMDSWGYPDISTWHDLPDFFSLLYMRAKKGQGGK